MAHQHHADVTAPACDSSGLEDIVARFEKAWQQGEPPQIDSFLAVSKSRSRTLLELVHADLKHRLQNDPSARIERYLESYPELAEDRQALLELIAAEYRLRNRLGIVNAAEYRQRFPDLADELTEPLDGAAATLATPPPPASKLSPAARSDGAQEMRYRVVRPHARGGLGEVFIAVDQELNREVALKEIQAEYAADALNRSRFLLEAEITGNLEHPGIVPVYGLGHYQDGRPFYAMRFIKGENLKEAIKRFHQPDGPERDPQERRLALRQLLGRFIDVCNAIAYAHSRGVLHRDLKPGNIMLGKYGETLVVDWGLAKPVGRPESASRDESTIRVRLNAGPNSDTVATQIGSAMGTPAYMSPEQAQGLHDLLGPASDIYSLGGTLYSLLTGQAPFQGDDYREVLDQVVHGDLVPPRRVNPEVPAALEAICTKAMAVNPLNRYRSALELAADVEHWLADEPVSAHREPLAARLGRWARRHRVWVAASAALLLATVVALAISTLLIGLEHAETEQARQEAEKNFQQAREQKQLAEKNAAEAGRQKKEADKNAAEALHQKKIAEQQGQQAQANFHRARAAVDQMLTEVSQRWLADLPLMEPLRRRILEKALTFYQGFLKEKSSDPEVRRDAGRAYLRLADIYQRLGQGDKAAEAYAQAIALFHKLADQFPGQADYRMDLAHSHNNRGILLASTGKSEEAKKAYQTALHIQKKLVAEFPEEPEYLQALAHSYRNLSFRLAAKQPKESLEAFLEAFEIFKRLAANFPQRLGYQQDLALGYNGQGLRLAAEAKSNEALEAHRQALDIQRKLVAKDPFHSEFWMDLSQSYYHMGIQLANTGKPGEAKEAYLQALNIRKKLVADFPTRPDYRHALAGTYYILGVRLSKAGNKKEAEDFYRQALKINAKLATDFPARPDYQQNLARTCSQLAFLLEYRGSKTEALEVHRLGVAVLKKLAKAFPTRLDLQDQLGKSMISLAYLLRDMNDFKEARPILEEAVIHGQTALKGDPKNSKIRRSVRNGFMHLAITLETLKDHAALAKNAAELVRVLPEDWQDYHRAARYLALAIPLAEADFNLTDVRRKELAQDYAGRSVQFLQQAVQKGLRNLQLLQDDPAFNRLRARADFKKLMSNLESSLQ